MKEDPDAPVKRKKRTSLQPNYDAAAETAPSSKLRQKSPTKPNWKEKHDSWSHLGKTQKVHPQKNYAKKRTSGLAWPGLAAPAPSSNKK